MQSRVTDHKGKEPEEMKAGLDARDVVGQFRSKSKIYELLSQNSKFSMDVWLINAG